MAAPGECMGSKQPHPTETPQIVVAVLGQVAAGVSQALYLVVNVL